MCSDRYIFLVVSIIQNCGEKFNTIKPLKKMFGYFDFVRFCKVTGTEDFNLLGLFNVHT